MRTRRLLCWVLTSRLPSLVIVLLVGLAVRLPYISQRSIWFDEAASWRTASLPVPDMLQSVRGNVHAPLYYVLLKCWISIFGDCAAALRSLSLVFGTATIVGMYLLGREVYRGAELNRDGRQDKEASNSHRGEHWFALLLASLVALSPFQIDASIETKMYSLGTALTAFSSWLLLRALRAERGSRLWEFYGVTLLALLYTHHYALLSVAAQFGFLGLFLGWRALRASAREALLLVRRLIIPGMLVAVGYLPWMLVLKEQTARVQTDYWTQPLTWDHVQRTLADLLPAAPGFGVTREFHVRLALVALLLVAAVWRPRRGNLLVLVCATVPVLLAAVICAFYAPIWALRYFRFAQLFFIGATALAIWRIPLAWLRGLAGALAIAIVGNSSIDYWVERDIPHRPGMRGVMERIHAENDQNAPIVVISSVHYFPARYYAAAVEVRLLSSDSPIPHYHGGPIVRAEDFISPAEVEARLATGMWIISRPFFPDEVRGLEACQVSHSFQTAYDSPIHSPIWAAFYRKAERSHR